jgi:hypothetical protein
MTPEKRAWVLRRVREMTARRRKAAEKGGLVLEPGG